MNRFVKIIVLLLALTLLTSAALSCKNEADEQQEDPAVTDVKTLLNAYYADINAKNYTNISYYYPSDTDVQERIDNFTFMSQYLDMTYEIIDVSALYLEDGTISASVNTKVTSTNLVSGDVTIMKEPSSYLIGKEGEKFVILTVSNGEGEIISMETSETTAG